MQLFILATSCNAHLLMAGLTSELCHAVVCHAKQVGLMLTLDFHTQQITYCKSTVCSISGLYAAQSQVFQAGGWGLRELTGGLPPAVPLWSLRLALDYLDCPLAQASTLVACSGRPKCIPRPAKSPCFQVASQHGFNYPVVSMLFAVSPRSSSVWGKRLGYSNCSKITLAGSHRDHLERAAPDRLSMGGFPGLFAPFYKERACSVVDNLLSELCSLDRPQYSFTADPECLKRQLHVARFIREATEPS